MGRQGEEEGREGRGDGVARGVGVGRGGKAGREDREDEEEEGKEDKREGEEKKKGEERGEWGRGHRHKTAGPENRRHQLVRRDSWVRG